MHGQTSTGMDRSISEENDHIKKQLHPREIASLVRNQQRTEGVVGNCWRDHLQRFEMMNFDEKLRTVCEEAGFKRPVFKGMYLRTSEDVSDGFGNLIASCRECSQLRAHQDSVVKLWIHRYTEIGPVRDVKIICRHGRHGIEIQISSSWRQHQCSDGHIQRPKSVLG